jgi:hypothetical protein
VLLFEAVRCALRRIEKTAALFIRKNIRAGPGRVELGPVNITAKSIEESNLSLSPKYVDKMDVSKFLISVQTSIKRRTAICKSINQ